jgi:uncharacterized damage-inducible protein DinB
MSTNTTLIKSFQNTDFIINLVLSDLKNEDAVKKNRNNKGSSISWIVGHLLQYRYSIINLLGSEDKFELSNNFGNSAEAGGKNYPEISELLKIWNSFSDKFYKFIESASDADLDSAIKNDSSPHNEKTKLDVIVFYMWHEAYHMGCIGMIRKEYGYLSSSELAVNASKNTN